VHNLKCLNGAGSIGTFLWRSSFEFLLSAKFASSNDVAMGQPPLSSHDFRDGSYGDIVAMLLYPQKQTSLSTTTMSAKCKMQTSVILFRSHQHQPVDGLN
jgi:hypothetical protein